MEALINIAFKREVIRKVTNVILPLNDIGVGPPFYCVHSLGGAATEFRDMARMLGPEQKFYGIQVPTDRRNAEFGRSIREMSRCYVNELIKFQPEGAFLLGGYSVGATIALEMSQQLIARGREVSLLVVFDGELLNTGSDAGSLHPRYWFEFLLNVFPWIHERLVRNPRATANSVFARLMLLASKRNEFRAPHSLERFISRKGLLPDHAAFMRALYANHLDYIPDGYSGRVVAFVAKTPVALLRRWQVKRAWTRIAPSCEVFEIDGTHESIMKMPQGRPVAERLRDKIEEIGGQGRA